MSIITDKKANARYWDEIDATIERMICEVADFSIKNLPMSEIADEFTDDGIIADVREMVISYLEKKGAKFPFVNENM